MIWVKMLFSEVSTQSVVVLSLTLELCWGTLKYIKNPTPCSSRTISSCRMMEFQAKLIKCKIHASYFTLYLKVLLEGTSYKKLHDTTSPFVSCCFTLASFIYINRYDFLFLAEMYQTELLMRKVVPTQLFLCW